MPIMPIKPRTPRMPSSVAGPTLKRAGTISTSPRPALPKLQRAQASMAAAKTAIARAPARVATPTPARQAVNQGRAKELAMTAQAARRAPVASNISGAITGRLTRKF